MREALGKDGIEVDIFFKMEFHLTALRGRVSNNSIATARSSLKGFTREQLQNIAERSTNAEWTAKPGYFLALIQEFRSRR